MVEVAGVTPASKAAFERVLHAQSQVIHSAPPEAPGAERCAASLRSATAPDGSASSQYDGLSARTGDESETGDRS
jgi:hypothetical protein